MTPFYSDELATIYHADYGDVTPPEHIGALILDPPFDRPELYAATMPQAPDRLMFTDPRHVGAVVGCFGAPAWVFTWDTLSPWNLGARRPLTQTKFCLWYGDLDSYRRDAALWGEAPPARNHPTTRQTPLDGHRLTDLWRESLRWLHHPEASTGAASAERFSRRQGAAELRHAKPLGWVRCLLANCSAGLVYDPFMGAGTSLMAATMLGRRSVGVDRDERACEYAARWLEHGTRAADVRQGVFTL